VRLARIAAIATFGVTGWLAGAGIVAAPASACVVAPSGSCAPDTLTVGAGSVQVGTTQTGSATSTGCTSGQCIVYTYTERVYRDPENAVTPACASAHNCLDWVVQISNNASSGDTIGRVTLSNFSGFTTDMGITSAAPGFTNASSPVAPTTVSRNSSGSALEWEWNSSAEIEPGETSSLLEAETNATQIVAGNINVIDGSTSTVPAYGPALPEAAWVPAIGLLGGVIGGAFVMRRRRQTLTPPAK
jgi:hypothetical protein